MTKNYFLIAIAFIFVACGNDTEELNTTFASTETPSVVNMPFTTIYDYKSPWEFNKTEPVGYFF